MSLYNYMSSPTHFAMRSYNYMACLFPVDISGDLCLGFYVSSTTPCIVNPLLSEDAPNGVWVVIDLYSLTS